jgi:hypothetical protein
LYTDGKDLEDFVDFGMVAKMADLGDADSLLRSDWIFEGIDDSVFKKTQMANNAKHMAVLND